MFLQPSILDTSYWQLNLINTSSCLLVLFMLSPRTMRVPVGAACRLATRQFATMKKLPKISPVAASIIPNLPYLGEDEDDPWTIKRDEKKMNQFLHSRKPVTSAHAVDTKAGKISNADSVAISASGTVVHGKYGELGPVADAIPLEYLALLRFAAEGAAGVRALTGGQSTGTLMVYGATQASGMAAIQIASGAGYTVVAVVSGDHSGNTGMVESVKGLINYPGTAVPNVYALSKKNFADLVEGIAKGDDGFTKHTAQEYLTEFKANLLDYAVTFPENLPAAVDAEQLKFNQMDKDREHFQANMEAYLSQFPPGSPSIDKVQLDAVFSTEQYEAFRKKFWHQTSNVISGDELHFFSPPHLVKDMMELPEKIPPHPKGNFPYSFSILDQTPPKGAEPPVGGPILGAIIVVDPVLESAAKAIDAAKTIRQKGEALSFLTKAQRNAFSAASSVAAVAKKSGAPVYTIGGNLTQMCARVCVCSLSLVLQSRRLLFSLFPCLSGTLPGLKAVEPQDQDVKEALAAMDIGDDGSSKLNYFVQTYRACDFPFYGDYAVHRAMEPMAGPRQIIVTK
jgi:hypothetical protein